MRSLKIAAAAFVCLFAIAVGSRAGGPIILMGIDAEDFWPGHGPIAVYADVVMSLINGASKPAPADGILVIGGDKDPTDDVTTFWEAIAAATGETVTQRNGAAISTEPFDDYVLVAIASNFPETPSGGLTQAENDLLEARQADIANHVNAGGALLGLTQNNMTNPFAYLGGVGAVLITVGPLYDDIDVTPEGADVGLTDALDVCCWHETFDVWPPFLEILAYKAGTLEVAALGGADVVVGVQVALDVKPASCPNPINVRSRGVLPVAIAGTAEFDVADIDPTTLLLEGVAPLRWEFEDVATPFEPFVGKEDCDLDCTDEGADGIIDLSLKFDTQEIVAAIGATENGCAVVTLTGALHDSTPIVGEDVVRIQGIVAAPSVRPGAGSLTTTWGSIKSGN